MSFDFYRVVHLLGIFMLFCAIGGLAAFAWLTRKNPQDPENATMRRRIVALHGVAMLVILVAGFGLMGKSGLMKQSWPLWIYGKLGLWLVMGAAAQFVRRSGPLGRMWLVVLPFVGGLAAYLAVFKP